jgi:predicted phosphodiesterase
MTAPLKTLRRMFRIQYVSDLHLEFYEKAVFPQLVTPNARYLALAGDIGQPGSRVFHSFLSYVSGHWDRVFYVPGNHEYYAKKPASKWKYQLPTPFHERHRHLREIVEAYKNIHFLDTASPSYFCEEENVAVVGSTLWSHVPDEHLVDAKLEMNDYSYIPVHTGSGTGCESGIRALHPDDTNLLHAEQRRVLAEQIERWRRRGADVCMITHHMPSTRLISPRYRGHHLNCCFASSCEDLMQPHVKAWIYGHTHNAAVTAIGKTITVCNARGYPNESVPGFGRDVFMEFKTSSGEEEAKDLELQLSALEITAPQCSAAPAAPATAVPATAAPAKDLEDIEFM